jgi:hypothetical protein
VLARKKTRKSEK